MQESRDYLEMSFHSINCFANDGTLDVHELEKILDIAKRDGVVDDNEKRVLSNIIGRLTDKELRGELRRRVEELQDEYQL